MLLHVVSVNKKVDLWEINIKEIMNQYKNMKLYWRVCQ